MAINLQAQLTSFIGREDDLTAVKDLLTASRLVTLTGVGGCGKTRLALQAANTVRERYTDGVWLVDLVPLREPDQILPLVAKTLDLHPSTDEPLLETVERFLASKHILLILDNCEHLSDSCAQLTRELLSKAPDLHILATSREVLSVEGEAVYPLHGLAWPAVGEPSLQNIDQLMGYDAVHLFVERARACLPGFRLTAENASTIIEICRQLDGLPLALELVSARVNIITVQEMAEHLMGGQNDRFALHLTGPRSSSDSRHHTLHDTIDWSFAHLSAEEQILFRRFAIFQSGFTLETAEAICFDEKTPPMPILEGISSLVRKSLVAADTLGRMQARYRLLETIRAYAQEKLEAAGETADLRDRHLLFFLTHAEEAAQKLTGAYQQVWLNWLESELDNLRAALAWSLESGQIEEGLRMTLALGEFWGVRGYTDEILAWFQRLMDRVDDPISPSIRVNALVYMSYIAMRLGNAQLSRAYGLEAVQVAETAGGEDNALLALASQNLGTSAMAVGDFQTAYTILEQAVPIYREAGPRYYYRMALNLQGETAVQLGYAEIALACLNESLALAQEDGDLIHVADIQNALGDLARLKQDYPGAASHYENSISLSRKIGAHNGLASTVENLGFTHLYFGKIESAWGCFQESMAIHQAQRNREGMLECLIGFAALAIVAGQAAAGMRLLAAVEAISGWPSASKWKATQMEVERYRRLARASLSETAVQAEQAAGRALSLEQALACAHNFTLEIGVDAEDQALSGRLTGREREIAVLIGQGKTNSEIAAELVLSKRTVETHVSKILAKLHLTRRAQIVHWAMDNKPVRLTK